MGQERVQVEQRAASRCTHVTGSAQDSICRRARQTLLQGVQGQLLAHEHPRIEGLRARKTRCATQSASRACRNQAQPGRYFLDIRSMPKMRLLSTLVGSIYLLQAHSTETRVAYTRGVVLPHKKHRDQKTRLTNSAGCVPVARLTKLAAARGQCTPASITLQESDKLSTNASVP